MLVTLLLGLSLTKVELFGDLGSVTSKIGSQFNEVWTVAPDLDSLQVWLQFENPSSAKVRTDIANCLNATWQERRTGQFYLSVTPTQATKHVNELRYAWSGSFRTTSAAWPPAISEPEIRGQAKSILGTLKSAIGQVERGELRRVVGPVDFLLRDILRAEGFDRVFPRQAFSATAYSNKPTVAEKALSPNSTVCITTFQKLIDAMKESFNESYADVVDEDANARFIKALTMRSKIDRVLLLTYRSEKTFFANLACYDSQGDLGSWTSLSIPIALQSEKQASLSEFTLSPSKTFQIASSISKGQLDQEKLTRDKLGEWLAAENPITSCAVEILREGFAGVPGNRVMVIPDSLGIELIRRQVGNKESLDSGLKQSLYSTEIQNGTLLGYPRYRESIGRLCEDRKSLNAWLSHVQESGQEDLWSVAKIYAENSNSISTSDLDDWYREKISAVIGVTPLRITCPRWLLMLFGDCSSSEVKSLSTGAPVSIGNIPFRSTVATNWTKSGIRSLTSTGAPVPDIFLFGGWSFPNGVPSRCSLRRSAGGEVTYTLTKNNAVYSFNAADIARMIARRTLVWDDSSISNAIPEKFNLEITDGDEFVVFLDGNLELRAFQETGTAPKTIQNVKFEKWPKEAKQKVRQALAAIKSGG